MTVLTVERIMSFVSASLSPSEENTAKKTVQEDHINWLIVALTVSPYFRMQ